MGCTLSWLLVTLRLIFPVLCVICGVSVGALCGVGSGVWFNSLFYQCVLRSDPNRCESAVVMQGLDGSKCRWVLVWLGRVVLAVCGVTKSDGEMSVGVGAMVRCRVIRRMQEVKECSHTKMNTVNIGRLSH